MGGADAVFFDTIRLLESKGNTVVCFSMHHRKNVPSEYEKYFVSNVDYEKKGIIYNVRAAANLLYSAEARRQIERLIADHKPDLAHIHSIYHQISPSILHSLKKYNIPVVMTLHDYKLICASYAMLADNAVCELCARHRYYYCFLKKCVKGSRAKSLLSTIEMYLHHTMLRIYDLVDVFISPSAFLQSKLDSTEFGGKVVHIPNFIDAGDFTPSYDWKEKSIVYFGRLSREKGIGLLMDAMNGIPEVELKIIGEGPLKEQLMKDCAKKALSNIRFLGYKSGQDLKAEIGSAMFTVVPSGWYENNPRAIIESFALGKPVIGARIGGIPELVRDDETGLTCTPFDAADLRSKIRHLLENPGHVREMGRKARAFVEKEFNPEHHYAKLMDAYRRAMDRKSGKGAA